MPQNRALPSSFTDLSIYKYHTISVSSRTAFFLSWWKVHCRFPHVRSRWVLLKVALWSMCNRPDGRTFLRTSWCSKVLIVFVLINVNLQLTVVRLGEKSSATNGWTPLRSGRLLRTSSPRVSHRVLYRDEQRSFNYEHARWLSLHCSGASFTPGAPLHFYVSGFPWV